MALTSLGGSLVEVEFLPASICVDDLIVALRELRGLVLATQADNPVNPVSYAVRLLLRASAGAPVD